MNSKVVDFKKVLKAHQNQKVLGLGMVFHSLRMDVALWYHQIAEMVRNTNGARYYPEEISDIALSDYMKYSLQLAIVRRYFPYMMDQEQRDDLQTMLIDPEYFHSSDFVGDDEYTLGVQHGLLIARDIASHDPDAMHRSKQTNVVDREFDEYIHKYWSD